jgi:hypothetical protein
VNAWYSTPCIGGSSLRPQQVTASIVSRVAKSAKSSPEQRAVFGPRRLQIAFVCLGDDLTSLVLPTPHQISK